MKTRMFTEVTRTWNPVPGCEHGCIYCYARELALGRLKDTPRYKEKGFHPQLVESELRRRFQQGTVFVDDMGDLWGKWVPPEWIRAVLEAVRASPKTTFLMLTKDPAGYHKYLDIMPPNVILGATIETDKHFEGISKAPIPWGRALALSQIPNFRRMVSIEPIMEFDLGGLVEMVKMVNPEFVYVGYANHNHHLPEPPLAKTQQLIAALGDLTEVRLKTIRRSWQENTGYRKR